MLLGVRSGALVGLDSLTLPASVLVLVDLEYGALTAVPDDGPGFALAGSWNGGS